MHAVPTILTLTLVSHVAHPAAPIPVVSLINDQVFLQPDKLKQCV